VAPSRLEVAFDAGSAVNVHDAVEKRVDDSRGVETVNDVLQPEPVDEGNPSLDLAITGSARRRRSTPAASRRT